MEIFLDSGKLISKEEWEEKIDMIRKKVESLQNNKNIKNHKKLKEELKKNILEAVKKRIPKSHFGVFLSGGVDSSFISLLCKKNTNDFTCYNVGFKDGDMDEAPDFVEAKKVAGDLGLTLISKSYNIDEAEEIIKEVVEILPNQEVNTDFVVKVGVASVVIAVDKIANSGEEDNNNNNEGKIFFSGLGSEEIFAGYKRHEDSKDINEECWNGLKKMWGRDLVRDCTVGSKLGMDLRTPFLDENVIITAMQISDKEKIKEDVKKYVLREVAEELGLPKEFAWRKKLGAQYGSRFDKAILKLAKKENINYKRDYLLKLVNGIN